MEREEFEKQVCAFASHVEGTLNQMTSMLAMLGNLKGMNPAVFYAGLHSALCSQISKVIVATTGPRVEGDEVLLKDTTRIVESFIKMSREEWNRVHAEGKCSCGQHHTADEVNPAKEVNDLIKKLGLPVKPKRPGTSKGPGEEG